MNTEHKKLINAFFIEVVIGLYALAVVPLCWKTPFLAVILLVSGLAAQLFLWRTKADAAAMLAAAALGTPAEILCVKTGIWTYYAPGLIFGIPVWIPLIWAFLFCLFRRVTITACPLIDLLFSGRRPIFIKMFYMILCAFILVYVLITIFNIQRVIAYVYSFFIIVSIVFWNRKKDILIFIIGAILGTLGEYVCMKLGFWRYHFPYFKSIGMPISLPLAWGLSSVIVGRIAGVWDKKSNIKLS